MRVLFLAVNTEEEPYPVYPLGLSVMAAAVSAAGHATRVCDALFSPNFHADIAADIADFQPDVIGLSLRNIDNVDSFTVEAHWTLDNLRNTCAFARRLTSVPLVLGGPGFSLMPQAVLAHCGADYGIAGEGEKAFLALLAALEAGAPPAKGLLSRQTASGTQGWGRAWDDCPLRARYAEVSGVVCLQSKRGCPHACAYCSYPILEGRRIRPRDPDEVADEILFLQRTATFSELFFTDAVFNDPDGRWLELAEAMLRRGIRVPWTAFFQPHGLEKDQLALCAATGLKALELGADAAADATLAGLDKHFDFAEVARSAELCRALDLPTAMYVMFCGPGENEKSLVEGARNLARFPDSVIFAFLGVRLYPGTPLHNRAVAEGSVSSAQSCLNPVFYHAPDMARNKADELLRKELAGRRTVFYPPENGMARIQAARALGGRGILWDSLARMSKRRGKKA